jgi:alginate O-acetyltransferase complex protein AlgI
MLFTTAAFACLFLPVVFALYFGVGRRSAAGAVYVLLFASLFFYAYWVPEYLLLLCASIGGNFLFGGRIVRAGVGTLKAKRWMIAGVVLNLLALAYFKYANFLVDSLVAVSGLSLSIAKIGLPIGISFFTFTQIAFLADAYQKGVKDYSIGHYALFVTYFPHLVAGPILHHAQMMPQFDEPATYRLSWNNLSAGAVLFAIGLFKKVVLADGVAVYADAVFNAASTGSALTQSEAWIGCLAYTFQLYFDFSGYSDMAIGISLLFNVQLPKNFNSPYRALDIADFWRRWHISLSTFLRDYLYIPLGGNRHGRYRRWANLMITMLLGGLWHGANWSFVAWGGLHGTYLVVHQAYRSAMRGRIEGVQHHLWYRAASWLLCFLCVAIAWVFFRAPDFGVAHRLLLAMAFGAPPHDGLLPVLWNQGLSAYRGWLWLGLCWLVAISPWNSNWWGERVQALATSRIASMLVGFGLTLALFLVLVNEMRASVSPFIYFNF